MRKIDIKNLSNEELLAMHKASTFILKNMSSTGRYKKMPTIDSVVESGTIGPDMENALRILNISIAANGYFYDNDEQGFLSILMERMYNERKEVKGKYITATKEIEAIKHELRSRGEL